jgi:hypothetical protein
MALAISVAPFPSCFNAALREAAQRERQSASEWVRRRLRLALLAEGIALPEFEPEGRRSSQRAA